MKIAYTAVNTSYAAPTLASALTNAIPSVAKIAEEYKDRNDKRMLVIVLTCPCCQDDGLLHLEDVVLVTPFNGISPQGLPIHQVKTLPPYGHKNGEKAETIEQYLDDFRAAIDQALAA
jgi:hypothetical protein